MWVARNKDGELYLHVIEPFRDYDVWDISGYEPNTGYWHRKGSGVEIRCVGVYLPDELFPQFAELKWEDEPLKVYLNPWSQN